MNRSLQTLLLAALLLSACTATALPADPPLPAAPSPEAPAGNLPAVVVLPAPASTPTPQPVPTATLEPTFTPTPTLHPMQIEAQRLGCYPGSDILIEEELERGSNYRRYYASYLSEGLKIYALLTVPSGEMPEGGWPAIVFNHGFIPPDIYRTTERYVAYVDRLARAGYIVFRIDYRGHDRSEGEASGAYGSPGYIADVLNAVSSLQRFPQANPEKIGMWGHSMGGYLTLRAMVISNQVKAGVIWSGVVASYPDMISRWRRSTPFPTPTAPGRRWRTVWLEEFGSPEANPEFWQSVSANSYLQDLSGPLQLHHGTADEDVPLEFSETLLQQVQAAGKQAELFTYPGDNHNISNYFSTAMSRTVEFFDLYLK